MKRAGKALAAVADAQLVSCGAQPVLAPVILRELTCVFQTLQRALCALAHRSAAQQRNAGEQQRPDDRKHPLAPLKPGRAEHGDRRHLAEGQQERREQLDRTAVVAADHVGQQLDISVFAYAIGHIHQKKPP